MGPKHSDLTAKYSGTKALWPYSRIPCDQSTLTTVWPKHSDLTAPWPFSQHSDLKTSWPNTSYPHTNFLYNWRKGKEVPIRYILAAKYNNESVPLQNPQDRRELTFEAMGASFIEELSDPACPVVVDATVELVLSVLVELLHHDQIRHYEAKQQCNSWEFQYITIPTAALSMGRRPLILKSIVKNLDLQNAEFQLYF